MRIREAWVCSELNYSALSQETQLRRAAFRLFFDIRTDIQMKAVIADVDRYLEQK